MRSAASSETHAAASVSATYDAAKCYRRFDTQRALEAQMALEFVEQRGRSLGCGHVNCLEVLKVLTGAEHAHT